MAMERGGDLPRSPPKKSGDSISKPGLLWRFSIFRGKKDEVGRQKKPVDHCDFPHLVGFRFLLSTQRVGQAGFGSRNLVGGFKYLVSFSHTTGMIG